MIVPAGLVLGTPADSTEPPAPAPVATATEPAERGGHVEHPVAPHRPDFPGHGNGSVAP